MVEEEDSELGYISPSATFTVRFQITSIEGKPPSYYDIGFSSQWDLLHKFNKQIPRWQSLALEPASVPFPRHGERIDSKEAANTLEPLLAVGRIGCFQTKQCSSMTLNAFLMLAAFLAGTATSGRYRRRR